jgi:hypothetical protein
MKIVFDTESTEDTEVPLILPRRGAPSLPRIFRAFGTDERPSLISVSSARSVSNRASDALAPRRESP